MSEPKPMLTADVLAIVTARAEKAEAELAAALEELAANKCVDDLLKAAMTHLAAAQKREAKLRDLCRASTSQVWFSRMCVLAILDGKEGD
jgi:predicted secreted protein